MKRSRLARHNAVVFLAVFFSLISLFSCADGPKYGTNSAGGPPTFTNLKATLLTPKCVSCHNTATPQSGVSVSSYEEVMTSASAVTPYQPGQSQMYLEFSQKQPHEIGTPLTDAELELIYQWISLGAKND